MIEKLGNGYERNPSPQVNPQRGAARAPVGMSDLGSAYTVAHAAASGNEVGAHDQKNIKAILSSAEHMEGAQPAEMLGACRSALRAPQGLLAQQPCEICGEQ